MRETFKITVRGEFTLLVLQAVWPLSELDSEWECTTSRFPMLPYREHPVYSGPKLSALAMGLSDAFPTAGPSEGLPMVKWVRR